MIDTDSIINWHRIDEPGDDPTWLSKCGKIEQVGFGNSIRYLPTVMGGSVLDEVSNLATAKRLVESAFITEHPEIAETEYPDINYRMPPKVVVEPVVEENLQELATEELMWTPT